MAGTKRIYVGMHDWVCAVTSDDGGKTWKQGPVTPLAHAAARLSAAQPGGRVTGIPGRLRSGGVPDGRRRNDLATLGFVSDRLRA